MTGYLLLLAFGAVVSTSLLVASFIRVGFSRGAAVRVGLASVAGAAVGGKALSVALHPGAGFAIGSGWSLDGGVIGAVFAVLVATRCNLPALDRLAAPFVVGLVFARIGCLLTGCCPGVPTDSVFGIHSPGAPILFGLSQARHASPVYEMVAALAAWIVACCFGPQRPGAHFFLFLSLFTTARLVLWTLREPDLATAVPPMALSAAIMRASLFGIRSDWDGFGAWSAWKEGCA